MEVPGGQADHEQQIQSKVGSQQGPEGPVWTGTHGHHLVPFGGNGVKTSDRLL